MNLERWNSVVCRIFFSAAFLLIGLALLERFLNLIGYTILTGTYTPGRMLEFAGIMLIAVIALLLRQIREGLKRKPI